MNEPSENPASVAQQLLAAETVDGDKSFAKRLASILEFTQLLYDDDENLTRVGNLSGVAKEKLQQRVLEVFDMAELKEDEEDEEDEDDEDDEGLEDGDSSAGAADAADAVDAVDAVDEDNE